MRALLACLIACAGSGLTSSEVGLPPGRPPAALEAAIERYRQEMTVLARSHAASAAVSRQRLIAEAMRLQQAAVDAGDHGLTTQIASWISGLPTPAASAAISRRSLREGTLTVNRGMAPNAEGRWVAKAMTSLTTDQTIGVPCRITIVGTTSDLNLRIGWLWDQLIFNWEGDPHTLVLGGMIWNPQQVAGQGWIDPKVMHRIVFDVDAQETSIDVDGTRRLTMPTAEVGLTRNLWIYSTDSIITIEDIVVEPLPAKGPQA